MSHQWETLMFLVFHPAKADMFWCTLCSLPLFVFSSWRGFMDDARVEHRFDIFGGGNRNKVKTFYFRRRGGLNWYSSTTRFESSKAGIEKFTLSRHYHHRPWSLASFNSGRAIIIGWKAKWDLHVNSEPTPLGSNF